MVENLATFCSLGTDLQYIVISRNNCPFLKISIVLRNCIPKDSKNGKIKEKPWSQFYDFYVTVYMLSAMLQLMRLVLHITGVLYLI